MAKDLTALSISNAKVGATRREIPDGKVRGLFFVVQPTGTRSWAVRYRRPDGTTRKLTIGSFPAIDLVTARRLANSALAKVAEGSDPAGEKQVALRAARKPSDHEIVENVVERFIERHAKKHTRETSWKEAQRLLNAEVVKRWKGRPLAEIKKADIHVILDAIIDRGSPIAANRALAVMSRLFSWAVEREIISASPCAGIKAPSPARTRDRVLSDDELRLIWSTCDDVGWPFGPLIQLLILTGQRRDEVGGMTWLELDFMAKLWTLPKGRVKNDKGHTVPLSDKALAILETLPHVASGGRLVFTTTGQTSVSGFTNFKEKVDRILAEKVGDDEMPGWTFHDLRRTMASGCARFGVAPQVVEAILNHKSGTIRGVAAVYNRYDHAPEKRAALELWGRHVHSIVSGLPASNVDLKMKSA